MRKTNDSVIMKQVVQLRAAVQRAAQLRVAQAARAIDDLDARRLQNEQAVQDLQSSWVRSVTAATQDLEISRTWATALVRSGVTVTEIEAQIKAAREEKSSFDQAWSLAKAKADSADNLRRSMARVEARRRERIAADEISDRFMQRGFAS